MPPDSKFTVKRECGAKQKTIYGADKNVRVLHRNQMHREPSKSVLPLNQAHEH
jgi:hypothetical protein